MRQLRLIPDRFQVLAPVVATVVWLCGGPIANAAPPTIAIPEVQSGDFTYEGVIPASVQIVIEDGRKDKTRFVQEGYGTKRLRLRFTSRDLDPLEYLGESVAKELTKHGVPASLSPTPGAAAMTIRVEAFDMDTRFASGFGPYTTLTRLRTVVTYEGRSQVVSGAMVRSKVLKNTPKKDKKRTWAYVFSDPVHMVVREATAKINRHFWNLSVADAKVDGMIAAVPKVPENGDATPLVDVACTNNQRAAKYLRSQVDDADQSHRRAAMWGLGLVGSNPDVSLLKKAAMTRGGGALALSLKSLGDIGTPEARAAMKEIEQARRPTLSERDVKWLDDILGLYR